ncbi:MAG: hypothetical protein ACTHKZ_06030 [Lysobacteraceae bacterium]
MNDDLRIELALARAAGLLQRAANDARLVPATAVPPAAGAAPLPGTTEGAFSPLALLLARFLPPAEAAAPPAFPTPDEARMLQAYLRQRVVAVLRTAGVAVPASMAVSVDADGALRLAPAPPGEARYAPLLRQEPDIAQLAAVLQHAAPAQAPPLGHCAAEASGDRTPGSTHAPDERPRWSWWLSFDTRHGGSPAPRARRNARAWWLPAIAATAALLLSWWLLR